MRELSIIIPAFENWKYSAICLASIFKSTYPKEKYEVIFVNNASTDRTDTLVSYLVEQGEPINYIKLDKNLNFIGGTNRGWKEVKTPFLMLLNNDAYVTPTCIEEMMKTIKSDDNIGVVGALEFLLNGAQTRNGKQFIFFDEKLDPVAKTAEEIGLEDSQTVIEVDSVGSACCIIRKEVSDKIGYFDELFLPCMYEQEDYWVRTKLAGYKICMLRKAKFVHVVGATTVFNNIYYQRIIRINRQKFLKKWEKEKERIYEVKVE